MMDSKPKTEVGIPHAETPPIRFDEGKRRRANGWLIGAVVVLALTVVALGVALIIQANSEETPSKASPSVKLDDAAAVALVEGFLAAHNTDDADTITNRYLPDAVAHWGQDTYTGRAAIDGAYWTLFGQVPDLRVERVTPVVRSGDSLVFMVRDSLETEMLWVLTPRDGKIAEEWHVMQT